MVFVSPPVGGPSAILELDALFGAQTLLAFVHATLSPQPRWALTLLASALACGLVVETLSVRAGGTHCHADGLLNFSACSSVNSVLMYGPWIYVCSTAARRLVDDGSFACAVLAGVLCFLQCGVYELQGPALGFWLWPRDDGVVKDGCAIWQLGEPGLDLRGLVVTRHAADALAERVFGVPIMAVYFHAAFGAGIFAALQLGRFEWPVLSTLFGPALALLCDPPLRLICAACGSNFLLAAPCTMAVATCVALLCGPPLHEVQKKDALLFSIPALGYTYFVSLAIFGRGSVVHSGDLKVLICAVAACGICAFGRATGLFSPASGGVDRPQKGSKATQRHRAKVA